jgi:hypothetical protein
MSYFFYGFFLSCFILSYNIPVGTKRKPYSDDTCDVPIKSIAIPETSTTIKKPKCYFAHNLISEYETIERDTHFDISKTECDGNLVR